MRNKRSPDNVFRYIKELKPFRSDLWTANERQPMDVFTADNYSVMHIKALSRNPLGHWSRCGNAINTVDGVHVDWDKPFCKSCLRFMKSHYHENVVVFSYD